MNILKNGSMGNVVASWQRFLKLKDDGIFGKNTEKSQRISKETLKADGIVGKNTYDIAIKQGFVYPQPTDPIDTIPQPSKPTHSKLIKISAKAPTPLMNWKVAPIFEELRKAVLEQSGVDFLSVCGDVFRPANFSSSKDGVANKSNHKTGRAFDYDQTNPHIIVVSDPSGGKQYFRTYLKCNTQDGSKGRNVSIRDYRGFMFNGYAIDFTQLAASYGFVRIPAWSG
ncbi:MAG: hypothetical protein LC096_03860, partial [Bacteroidia bacterium]|nr:hypothetical protein [Bacteroidia bacterium]